MNSPIVPPRRSRVVLSLRVLMVVILAIGCALGWLAYRIRVQRQAVVAIRKAGGFITFDWEKNAVGRRIPNPKPPGPPWLRNWIGPEMFETVKEVTFQFPSTPDDSVMAHVGKLRGLRRLALTHGNRITSAAFNSIRGLTKLESLELVAVEASDDDLACLSDMTSLTWLRVGNLKLTNAGLKHLRRLTKLQTLMMVDALLPKSCRIDAAGLSSLEGMTKLVTLDIRNSRITTIAPLRPLKSLKILGLGGNPIADVSALKDLPLVENVDFDGGELSDKDMKFLASIPRLNRVCASGAGITDAGVKDLGRLSNLQTLWLRKSGASDFSPLSALPKLSWLWLGTDANGDGHPPDFSRFPMLRMLQLDGIKLSEADMIAIGKLKGMTRLQLIHAGIDDVSLNHLSGLAVLRDLKLGRDPITDAGLASLQSMKRLSGLSLSLTKVTGLGLAKLTKLPLSSLILSGCPIDGAGVALLPKFPRIAYLGLTATPVSDADIPTLSKLTKCRTFELRNTRVTAAGAAALKQAVPVATIQWGSIPPRPQAP